MVGIAIRQGFEESDTWFDVALRVAREFLKMHIISSDSDKIAVVFYGTVSFDARKLKQGLSFVASMLAFWLFIRA